ncbi:C40 family peptidase [Bacillus sp. 2205SS5-2]|uniref:C40 family peptidase n=1 Tax=Bacillus sp. 2205SS5-2 TaxID=3109031 RepID=UPI0030079AC8
MKKTLLTLTTAAFLTTGFASTAGAASYTVKSGDSLSLIAKNYGTTVTSLKQANHLTGDLIYINQTLAVPDGSTASTYTVRSGDYLYKIAKIYGLSVPELKNLNGLTSDLIYVGQTLKVAGTAATPEPKQTTMYTVQAGDTLSHIAKRNSMSVSQLKDLNSLSSDLIYVGQTLKVSTAAVTPEPTNAFAVATLISEAKKVLGTPYLWAGTTPSGFDCSGFIYYAFNQAGKDLARTNTDGYYSLSVSVSNPQPGDLVFFENTYKSGISHMGIYLGNNEFIHASSSKGVSVTSLSNTYWGPKFAGYKRIK